MKMLSDVMVGILDLILSRLLNTCSKLSIYDVISIK